MGVFVVLPSLSVWVSIPSVPAKMSQNSEGKPFIQWVEWFGMPRIVRDMWKGSRILSWVSVCLASSGSTFPSWARVARRVASASELRESPRLKRPPGACAIEAVCVGVAFLL